VIVGKSITFDSGGISIKPAEKMEQMKTDMSGGATVLGTMKALAQLKLPVSVVGLLPATENMPSGTAVKPGDVVRAMSGKTIEVINTDAEGRMILADALSYAARYKPSAVVDLATLTGACVVALGNRATGVMGTNPKLIDQLKRAGERCGERVWELPLWEEYQEQIKSDVADMKNVGGRGAGAITAAAFLQKFVDDYPWAHLDIAGTSWNDDPRPYSPKGATGVGVRLLVQWLTDTTRNRT
jgi:leucyl aminopeptidase